MGDTGDTIFALSSGSPPAAIAIVRISGPAARAALAALAGEVPAPRHAVVRPLRDAAGALLDRALILWFPGPASATGEDLAELHLHGGRAVVAAVLAALAGRAGLRMAEAGEFTRRAFASGRLDLARAEGLADLLAAETEAGRRQALRLAEGGLGRLVEEWRARLVMLAARAEAVLEFGDDAGDVAPDPALIDDIGRLAIDLAEMLRHPPAERLRDGFRVVVAGPPNAGKSSLINKLANREAAIVTDAAGTTRDLIEVPLDLGGMPVILIDSAGLREADDIAERIGVDRAKAAIAGADLLLWLGDPDRCPRPDALKIHARMDLPDRRRPPAGSDAGISVVTNAGIGELHRLIGRRLAMLLPQGERMLLNSRHRHLLAQCKTSLDEVGMVSMPELVAEQLRAALGHLDRITGRADVEAMLDALFGRFCIGK